MEYLDRYLPVPKFLIHYPFSRTHVYELLKNGRLKAIKLRSRTLIDTTSADALLKEMPSYVAPSAKVETSK